MNRFDSCVRSISRANSITKWKPFVNCLFLFEHEKRTKKSWLCSVLVYVWLFLFSSFFPHLSFVIKLSLLLAGKNPCCSSFSPQYKSSQQSTNCTLLWEKWGGSFFSTASHSFSGVFTILEQHSTVAAATRREEKNQHRLQQPNRTMEALTHVWRCCAGARRAKHDNWQRIREQCASNTQLKKGRERARATRMAGKTGKSMNRKQKQTMGEAELRFFRLRCCVAQSAFSLSRWCCLMWWRRKRSVYFASVSSMKLCVEHFHVIVSRERHRGANRKVQVKSNSMAQRSTMTSLIKRQFCRPHDQNAYQFLWMKIEKFPIQFQRFTFFLLLFWLLIEVSVNRLRLSIAVWTESPSSLLLGMSKIVLDTLFLVLVVAEWRSIKTQFSS